jgi:hypothetical protein
MTHTSEREPGSTRRGRSGQLGTDQVAGQVLGGYPALGSSRCDALGKLIVENDGQRLHSIEFTLNNAENTRHWR